MTKLWAIEFQATNGHWWINHLTVRSTKREAFQAALDMTPGAAWWDEFHRQRDAGKVRAVRVRVVREAS